MIHFKTEKLENIKMLLKFYCLDITLLTYFLYLYMFPEVSSGCNLNMNLLANECRDIQCSYEKLQLSISEGYDDDYGSNSNSKKLI